MARGKKTLVKRLKTKAGAVLRRLFGKKKVTGGKGGK